MESPHDTQDIMILRKYRIYILKLKSKLSQELHDPGFCLQKRTYQEKLPVQGNVYPMTSMAYIDHDKKRLTVLASQSAGVSSIHPGWWHFSGTWPSDLTNLLSLGVVGKVEVERSSSSQRVLTMNPGSADLEPSALATIEI